MVKVMLAAIVSTLIIIPMFLSCTQSTQAPPQITVDNQSVRSQAPVPDDNKVLQPTPVDATPSKVKGFVYESFDGGTQIYYKNEIGADRVKLGIANKSNGEPAWSPDGKQVAFISEGCLYVTDLGSDNISKLADVARNPVWSPDSKKIAYILDGDRTNEAARNKFYPDSLYVINADGTDSKQMTEKQMMFTPMWSPDGTQLVFIAAGIGGMMSESDYFGVVYRSGFGGKASRADYFGNSDIFVINAGGSYDGATNITNTVDASEKNPRWSPDGQYIAFLSNNADGSRSTNDSWNLYVMRNDGTEVRKLNGDSIIWNGYAGQSRNYANTISPDSMESAQDRMSEMYGPFITWSPDGKYITVCTVRARGPASFGGGSWR
jgi:Tol biopolymer transport system component